ncbi:hypothetical protein [Thalassobius vesicularis]|uniref:hypothetical protein n=1 Tax=Thalassobius vesicularis TaxID=1294297 RepID=UPI001B3B2520|nr:hypothetical protein [Thalassobius vesicularis]
MATDFSNSSNETPRNITGPGDRFSGPFAIPDNMFANAGLNRIEPSEFLSLGLKVADFGYRFFTASRSSLEKLAQIGDTHDFRLAHCAAP